MYVGKSWMINVKFAIDFHYANQKIFTLQTRFYHLIDFLQNLIQDIPSSTYTRLCTYSHT